MDMKSLIEDEMMRWELTEQRQEDEDSVHDRRTLYTFGLEEDDGEWFLVLGVVRLYNSL